MSSRLAERPARARSACAWRLVRGHLRPRRAGIFGLSYVLLARSLEQRDREAVRMRLTAYASEYETGGLAGLWRGRGRGGGARRPRGPLRARARPQRRDGVPLACPAAGRPRPQRAGHARAGDLRRAGRGPARADDVLELASLRLADGTVLQVGAAPRRARELLQRFRTCSASCWRVDRPRRRWPAGRSSRAGPAAAAATSPRRWTGSCARAGSRRACRRARAGTRSTSWCGSSTRCSGGSSRWSGPCAARSTTWPTTCARR